MCLEEILFHQQRVYTPLTSKSPKDFLLVSMYYGVSAKTGENVKDALNHFICYIIK